MSDITKRIADLPFEKRQLLERYLKTEGGQLARNIIIPRGRETNKFPLSFAQQRLWFLHQMEPESAVYNLPDSHYFSGPLNEQALERSLNEIVRRHEILRTTFQTVEAEPSQVISAPAPVRLETVDLSHLPSAEREAEAHRLADHETQRSFDLARGPLLRARLLKLAEEEHVLLITTHHIISDGWSMGVMEHELTTLYDAFVGGQPSPLAELPIQYADYAVWQREWLQGSALEEQLNYWRQQLSGQLPVMELPADRPRPATLSFRGAWQTLTLALSLTEQLTALSQKSNVTLFMTLLAAFKVLLSRYTGHEDIIVGTPIAGRNRAEIEKLIGFFVNTLVLRTDLAGNPSFQQVLASAREITLGAFAHQDLPFEKLVEELQPERSLNHTPLFQVMFALQNMPLGTQRLQSLSSERFDVDTQTAKFDLTLFVNEIEDGLFCSFQYNVDLFDEATIERLAGHWRTLLEGIVANPQQRLADLPLLSAAERRQLLEDFNQTQREYPRDSCIQQLFEEQAERTPDAVALSCGSERLSYRELNRRANQVGQYLRACGVGAEELVGVMLERSLEMVAGVLGVLKAGGAYLPLDATYPALRLRFMMEDAGMRVLLTEQRYRAILPTDGLQVICMDADREAIGQMSAENPDHLTSAGHLAYVTYTSGSTGQPKGVGIPHRGIARLVKNTNYADLGPQEVFLLFAPLTFDASTFEIWGSLLNGARLAIMPAGLPSLAELSRVIKDEQVTTLWLTSGLFHQMAESHLPELLSARRVMSGGDVLSVSHVEKFLSAAGEQNVLFNCYGPTENTTFTSCHPMAAGTQLPRSVPIGRPVANTQIYILDRYMQPVASGVVGELYAGGDGLARGYHNQAQLTAERFVPHPFSAEAGARLYRTGDLARHLPDGNIEFLGRKDEQVKIRGFRIEPGEIESALREHEQAREVVVMAREDTPGDKRLVAYIVAQPGATAPACDWQAFLKERLPEYMLPTAFVTLDALPLTPHGKVDRQALPLPEPTAEAAVGFVAPRTELEETLASIWREVLGAQQVGVESNFFELGGHSLMATRVVSHVRERLGVEIPLRVLFELPTVAALARHIEAVQPEQTDLERLSLMLEKLEDFSEDEVRAMLALTESERTA